MFRYIIILALAALIIYFLIVKVSNKNKNKNENYEPESIEDDFENSYQMGLIGGFKSCGCPELVTWHPGQIVHKLKCSKFWKLNPGRTKNELVKAHFGTSYEAFKKEYID